MDTRQVDDLLAYYGPGKHRRSRWRNVRAGPSLAAGVANVDDDTHACG